MQERTTRVVIVRSLVPRVFSAGADLKERATMTQVWHAPGGGSAAGAARRLGWRPPSRVLACDGPSMPASTPPPPPPSRAGEGQDPAPSPPTRRACLHPPQAETAEFVALLRHTFSQLESLPMPTVAAVEGAAMGGGAEMALACDLRVADVATATFAFPEVRDALPLVYLPLVS